MSHGWPYLAGASGNEVEIEPGLVEEDFYEIHLEVKIVEELPPLPASEPITVSKHYRLGDQAEGLAIFRQPGHFILQDARGGVIKVPSELNERRSFITANVKRRIAEQGYLEDITFISLAPLLRRRGYYLVHAFAVAKDGRALLLVGPSGSGKSTTGLNLVTNGWGFLANDVVLVRQRPDGVYAFPTPGSIGISEETIDLVTGLKTILGSKMFGSGTIKRQLSVLEVSFGWAEPARIEAIYFPRVVEESRCRLQPKSKVLTLAQLLENSVDRWDGPCLEGHVSFLQQLCRQAQGFDLYLGRQTDPIPDLLSTF